jgi:hypothetical protein
MGHGCKAGGFGGFPVLYLPAFGLIDAEYAPRRGNEISILGVLFRFSSSTGAYKMPPTAGEQDSAFKQEPHGEKYDTQATA